MGLSNARNGINRIGGGVERYQLAKKDVETKSIKRGLFAGLLRGSSDKSEAVKAAADQLHDELIAAGVDVVLDDRGERPGAMFADWELIGVPHRVNIGDRALKEGHVEYQHRRDAAASAVARGRPMCTDSTFSAARKVRPMSSEAPRMRQIS